MKKHRVFALVVLFVMGQTPLGFAQDSPSYKKLLPDVSAIGSFAGAYFSQEPQGETGHDPARTGFTLQEIELAVQSVVDPYFRADIFLAFHEEEVEIEEAYLTSLVDLQGFQFRAGQFLLPFGRQNSKHIEQWDFVNTPLINRYFLGVENLNEIGVELSYLFPTPFFLQAQTTVSNGDNEASFNGGQSEDMLYQGRLSASVDLPHDVTLLWGGSAAFGWNDSAPGNSTQLYGGDLLVKWKGRNYRGLTWQSEYLIRHMELGGAASDGGLYSYMDYRFLKRWHAGVRVDAVGFPGETLNNEWRLGPIVTFTPTEFSRLRLQYDYDKPDGQEAVHAVALQLQFNIGPHGAHAF